MVGKKWFVLGMLGLGLLIGFMAGLSVSPVVNTLLGLVFAFAGGSVIVLVKGRDDYELKLIGKSVTAISIAMIVGVITGIAFRANDLLNLNKPSSEKVRFKLEKSLETKDIIQLSEKGVDPMVIRTLLYADTKEKRKEKIILKMEHILQLTDENKVHPSIICAMVDKNILSDDSPFTKKTEPKNDGGKKNGSDTVLYANVLNYEREIKKLESSIEKRNKAIENLKHKKKELIEKIRECEKNLIHNN